jgi:hypothetical protein
VAGWEEDDVVPCPTCWLLAEVVPPPPYQNFPHAICPKGHDNTLIPAVHEHLRSMLGPAFSKPA